MNPRAMREELNATPALRVATESVTKTINEWGDFKEIQVGDFILETDENGAQIKTEFKVFQPQGASPGKFFLRLTPEEIARRVNALGLQGTVVDTGWLVFLNAVITPRMARSILEKFNQGNRRMAPANMYKVANAINAGDWHLIHQGGAFAEDPRSGLRIADMQHRLQAIAHGATAVPVLICLNLPFEAIKAVDMGKGRGVFDQMNFFSQGDVPREAPGMCKRAILGGSTSLYLLGEEELRRADEDNPMPKGGIQVSFSDFRVVEKIWKAYRTSLSWAVEQFPDGIYDTSATSNKRKKGLPVFGIDCPAVKAAIAVLKEAIDTGAYPGPGAKLSRQQTLDKLDSFICALTFQPKAPEGHPALVLAGILSSNRGQKKKGVTEVEKYQLTLKAFALHCAGDVCRQIRLSDTDCVAPFSLDCLKGLAKS